MTWRVAKSLLVLLDQVNAQYPHRNKASDGTIGDAAHQAQGSASDHNPWVKDKNGIGVVTALDITHDPKNGVDIDKLSDELVASRDPRIKYIIANGLIAGPYNGWQWQQSNGHHNHIHISVNTNNYDVESKWKIGGIMTPEQSADIVRYVLRVLNSEAKGWDRTQTHKGDFDKKELDHFIKLVRKYNGDALKALAEYSQQAWNEGALYRSNKDAWRRAFNEKAKLLQKIAALEKAAKQNDLVTTVRDGFDKLANAYKEGK